MRIHFTRLDLARTQLTDGPDPMWEMVNSLQALQSRYRQAELRHWRRDTAQVLRGRGLAAPVRHKLFALAPHAAYFPDLITPLEGALGLEAGIDAVLSTPRQRIVAELDQLRPARTAPLEDLRSGRAADLHAWGELLRSYYRSAVDPVGEQIAAAVDRDLATRRAAVHTGGVEGLLSSFDPLMRWSYPVLELPNHPSGRDVHLEGRGLRLIPSYFCRVHPLTVFDASLPQVVVYPIRHHAASGVNSRQALSRLLGETRAAVLISIHQGCGTGALAQRVGISAPAVSHHIGVLRDAGLVTSSRSGTGVRHTRSRLGDALIRRHAPPA
ncbi:helix-turn-helix protein [Asanoa ferruginea]|uniref:Helix-turn-helix protein n=1 Tax=Asanoa ferruginea TaxID=53367 RepID=A0A3D9ZPJ8_9ACTN|nr:winged helix-turn-helix domain-containing protein [Asanoa ferruginea]REF99298.1 helix-turn-helix protein [Asanoa ferruginea]GIF45897.1 transcriptional regulator [Asanoa ferruginea]